VGEVPSKYGEAKKTRKSVGGDCPCRDLLKKEKKKKSKPKEDCGEDIGPESPQPGRSVGGEGYAEGGKEIQSEYRKGGGGGEKGIGRSRKWGPVGSQVLIRFWEKNR